MIARRVLTAPLFPDPGGRPRPLGRVFCLALALVTPLRAGPWWAHYAGTGARDASVAGGPSAITEAAWLCSSDAQGRTILFVGQSSPVVSRDLVLAIGSVVISNQRQFRLYAVDRRSGALRWEAPVARPASDSWSSPALDLDHNSAIVATGNTVASFALADGHTLWQRPLGRNVVNASPLVTSRAGGEGLGAANRVFITEYDGFGNQGRLTCINTDARMGNANAFDPGQVVWSIQIGSSSGNSCAMWKGTVFVTTAGEDAFMPGRIMAFDARATTAPAPLWVFENPAGYGFFGGLCVRESGGVPWLFAASYDFYGGLESGNLLKLNGASGDLAWSVSCNRTVSIPALLGDGRIALSAGVNGYGTVPNLQLFRDDEAAATPLWDSALSTWTDLDHDGNLDAGEYLYIGGWTHQPVVAAQAARTVIYTASPPTGPDSFAASTALYALDVAALPMQPGSAGAGLIAGQFIGAGSAPAIADGNLYTIGAAGLYSFGPAPFQYDVNSNGLVDIEDLYAWEQGVGARDVDLDGVVNQSDRSLLEAELRRCEPGGVP